MEKGRLTMIFTKDYWSSSAEKLKSVRYLAIMAIFIALKTMMSSLYIPVSENLRIGFSFIVTAVEGAVIGPVAGLISGAVTDLVGFMIFPSGPFFFGYTITSMLGVFLYALFLYRQKITILRLALCKFSVSALCNVILGSLWSAMLYSKGYLFYLTNSLIKNAVLLPVEIMILVLVFNVMIPVLTKSRLIEPQNPLPLKWK